MSKFIDLIGQKFGRLTPIQHMGKNKHNKSLWLCECDCGETIQTTSSDLKTEHTRSCGCLSKEVHNKIFYKHGYSHSRIHNLWSHMVDRCNSPNNKDYHNYGGRGICVCERWSMPNGEGFKNFLEDVGIPKIGLTLDRIDNDGNYCLENHRWATRKEQCRNKRISKFVVFNHEKRLVIELAEEHGIPYKTLWRRLYKDNYTVEQALNIPLHTKRKK